MQPFTLCLCLQVYSKKAAPRNPLLDQIRVLHDDDHICVVYKPPGVYTHGHGRGRSRKSLMHVIDRVVARSKARDAFPRPAPVQRLDKGTEGLVTLAKSLRAAQGMREQFDVHGGVHKRCVLQIFLQCTSGGWLVAIAKSLRVRGPLLSSSPSVIPLARLPPASWVPFW